MKKMWKQMAMALIGIGAVLSVSACGGKENTTSNEPQTTANVAESEAKTEIKVALWDYTSAKYYRNLLGGLYRENPVKSRNYEAVKSSKKWENVGNSYIIPALLLYRYSYI